MVGSGLPASRAARPGKCRPRASRPAGLPPCSGLESAGQRRAFAREPLCRRVSSSAFAAASAVCWPPSVRSQGTLTLASALTQNDWPASRLFLLSGERSRLFYLTHWYARKSFFPGQNGHNTRAVRSHGSLRSIRQDPPRRCVFPPGWSATDGLAWHQSGRGWWGHVHEVARPRLRGPSRGPLARARSLSVQKK